MSNLVIDMHRRALASGFGFVLPEGTADGSWSVISEGGNTGNTGNDVPWYIGATPILAAAAQTVSNIFGNQYQQRPQVQQFQPQYQQFEQNPYGNNSRDIAKSSLDNVTDFISDNFLLVGAGVLGVILLFRQPPGRR